MDKRASDDQEKGAGSYDEKATVTAATYAQEAPEGGVHRNLKSRHLQMVRPSLSLQSPWMVSPVDTNCFPLLTLALM